MRLLFCIDHFGSGGAQRQLVTLAMGLHERGHEVEFFIYHPRFRYFAEAVESRGMTIHVFEKKNKFSPQVVFALGALIKRHRYHGVLAFLDTPSLYAELATIGRWQPPLVVSERNTYTSLGTRVQLLQRFHRLATHITVNSHHQREKMVATFPWMAAKISTIYNGVDLEAFSPGPAPGPKANPIRLLAVARTAVSKNAEGLIRALAVYREAYGPPPTVAWAGSQGNTRADARTHGEAVALLEQLDLQDNWQWLGERRDIAELMRSHDALVHPSFFEGLPNAICEALACGRPVLASAVCDHPRLIQEGRTGFLFDPSRPEDIAAALHRFSVLDQDGYGAMAAQARRFAEAELSLARYVDAYETLFLRLAAEKRAA